MIWDDTEAIRISEALDRWLRENTPPHHRMNSRRLSDFDRLARERRQAMVARDMDAWRRVHVAILRLARESLGAQRATG